MRQSNLANPENPAEGWKTGAGSGWAGKPNPEQRAEEPKSAQQAGQEKYKVIK